jgi:hypothetical protein
MNSPNDYHGKNKQNEHNKGTKIKATDAITILENIKQSIYGEHDLLVYFCHGEFEEIFVQSCKDAIINKNEIFLLATYYQDLDYVRKKLRMAGIDVTKYESIGALVIMDSEIVYQPHIQKSNDNDNYYKNDAKEIENTCNMIIITNQLIRHAEKTGKNGVTIFGDLGPFILNNNLDELIFYEQSIPAKIPNTKIRLICCYHKKDFIRLSEQQRQKILALHTNSFIIT